MTTNKVNTLISNLRGCGAVVAMITTTDGTEEKCLLKVEEPLYYTMVTIYTDNENVAKSGIVNSNDVPKLGFKKKYVYHSYYWMLGEVGKTSVIKRLTILN